MSENQAYLSQLSRRFWNYAERNFGDQRDLFDRFEYSESRPPVFAKGQVSKNVLLPPGVAPPVRDAVLSAIPERERHKHFGSMRSSQALTQSVFANLSALGKVAALKGLRSDEGRPAFFDQDAELHLELERRITHLGEPRSTSVDVWLEGAGRVAVECKLTEAEFGTCSRPKLKPGAPTYEAQHCDGTYTHQRGRKSRCSLTEIGVAYWQHFPNLFTWNSDANLMPCPLRSVYQIARNVLAACVRPDGVLVTENAHALVLYDDRNPSFLPGGVADRQWQLAVGGLEDRSVLRRCSWQRLVAHLARHPDLDWLVQGLSAKYGLERGQSVPEGG